MLRRILDIGAYVGIVVGLVGYGISSTRPVHTDVLYLTSCSMMGAAALAHRKWAFVLVNASWAAVSVWRLTAIVIA